MDNKKNAKSEELSIQIHNLSKEVEKQKLRLLIIILTFITVII